MSKLWYTVAKCTIERSCPKCASLANPLVVQRKVHSTLFCSSCGAFIKHASIADKEHFYLSKINVEDGTPMKLALLIVESHKTMTVKLK